MTADDHAIVFPEDTPSMSAPVPPMHRSQCALAWAGGGVGKSALIAG
jgi:hypothetical protein